MVVLVGVLINVKASPFLKVFIPKFLLRNKLTTKFTLFPLYRSFLRVLNVKKIAHFALNVKYSNNLSFYSIGHLQMTECRVIIPDLSCSCGHYLFKLHKFVG